MGEGVAMPTPLYVFAKDGSKASEVPHGGSFDIRVNGRVVDYSMKDGYLELDQEWKRGDVVSMDLPMPVRNVVASPMVPEDAVR